MAGDRYIRHQDFLGYDTWRRLKETPVLVAGVGGLGSHVLQSIARLAPLTLEIWDPGTLNEPDLNRQILYREEDLHRKKVEAASDRLREINSELNLATIAEPLSYERFLEKSSLRGSGFLLFDCLDTFTARGELDRIRELEGCAIFHGGVEGWFGQASTLRGTGEGYARLFGPEYTSIPPAAKPILPQTVSAVASFQVADYLHWCETPEESPLSDVMLLYDGRSMRVDRVALARRG
ncbi:MAG: HesA/MoeB/ThiF family protein [Alkalispirochaetaceae bacterium]